MDILRGVGVDGATDSFEGANNNRRGRTKVGLEELESKLVVTDMREALRSPNRVNIYVDYNFAFSLDISQVVDFKLKIGRILEPNELEDMRRASEFGKLYATALEWVLMRPRSVKETRDYLKKKRTRRIQENQKRAQNAKKIAAGEDLSYTKKWRDADGFCHEKRIAAATKALPEYSVEDLDLVLARLVDRGYVDDLKFAKYFVENRFVKKGVSRKRLELELKTKGISEDIVRELFAESERDENEEIRKVIMRKSKRYDDKNKLIAYLARQGFSYDLIKEELDKLEDGEA